MARTKDVPWTYKYFIGEREVTELPPDYLDRMAERVTETVSAYYKAHPDEYKLLMENLEREEAAKRKSRKRRGESAKGSDIRGAGAASR